MYTSENAPSADRVLWLRKRKRERIAVFLCKTGLLALIIFLWEYLAIIGVFDSFITSSPSRILKTLSNLWVRGELIKHIAVTTGEAVAGFILGTILGTAVAVLLWFSPFLCKVIEPYLVVLNALPKIALGPIFIVWLGQGPKTIIIIALTISIVVTILEVLGGFMSTDQDMIKLVQPLELRNVSCLQKLYFLQISQPSLVR